MQCVGHPRHASLAASTLRPAPPPPPGGVGDRTGITITHLRRVPVDLGGREGVEGGGGGLRGLAIHKSRSVG